MKKELGIWRYDGIRLVVVKGASGGVVDLARVVLMAGLQLRLAVDFGFSPCVVLRPNLSE